MHRFSIDSKMLKDIQSKLKIKYSNSEQKQKKNAPNPDKSSILSRKKTNSNHQSRLIKQNKQIQNKRVKTENFNHSKYKFEMPNINIKKHQKVKQLKESYLNNFKSIQINLPHQRQSQLVIPKIPNSKISTKEYGFIKSYAANTHQGIYRQYNEDRISIILNLSTRGNMNYFAIFDGHGGSFCSQYMSNYFYNKIRSYQLNYQDPKKALEYAFKSIQQQFLNICRSRSPIDRSGSCALVCLVVQNIVYIANLGDSRAILLQKNKVTQITQDHKPAKLSQKNRIQSNGGKIYRTKYPVSTNSSTQIKMYEDGPFRVLPGRLSVSRTLGDIEAKQISLGGIPNVVSCQPQIFSWNIIPNSTLVLCSDGVSDRLSNEQLKLLKDIDNKLEVHQRNGRFVEDILYQSMKKNSYDNISAISIQF